MIFIFIKHTHYQTFYFKIPWVILVKNSDQDHDFIVENNIYQYSRDSF